MKVGIRRPWGFHRDVAAIIGALREVVRRIVEVADPEEIILFGSAARGRLKRHSDFDLLVVTRAVEERGRLVQRLRSHLFGLPIPVDVIIVTPEEVHEARGHTWTFLARALRGGRSIYRARETNRQGVGRTRGGWSVA